MLNSWSHGSIAVGKSFVLRTLAELGCHVIDADEIAREVVARRQRWFEISCEVCGEERLATWRSARSRETRIR